MFTRILLLSVLTCGIGFGKEPPSAHKAAIPINSALQEIHDLCVQRTRLRIHHRTGHPRFAEIERRIDEIHHRKLREFQTVAKDACLECSEEPRFGQPSYGIILNATSVEDIAAGELLLFHGSRVYRTSGSFPKLTTKGEGWYFRPNVDIPKGTQLFVACIQDAPEEIENVKNGFMPNTNRARNPNRPYRTKIFGRDGKPLAPKP